MDRDKLLLLKCVKPRNYWNTIGSGSEFFPDKPRKESIPQYDKKGRVQEEPKDEWWINSKKHHYCFWSLVKDRSGPDGRMDSLLQAEIAELFGCSSTKVHFMLQKALENFKNSPILEVLQELDSATEESDEIFDPTLDLNIQEEEEDPQDSEN